MKFSFLEDHNIPQGAWCAVVKRDCEAVKVVAGEAVCKYEDWFVFGVWDGDFSAGRFDKSQFACCSGGSVNNCKWGGVKFTTPFHLLETVYGIRKDDMFYVSNSLPFVLKMAKAKIDENYMDYQRDLVSSIFGQDRQVLSSPLKNGLRIQYFRGCNFEIDKQLNVSIEHQKSNMNFHDYNSYSRTILDVLTRIKDNARSIDRKRPYGMITTISRGYDAVASSALAFKIGCRKAFTFNRPASYVADDGECNAKAIGYTEIYTCDASIYKQETEKTPEAENIASGEMGPDILAPFSDYFKNSVLFMGTRGDSVWERNNPNVNDNQDFTYGNTFSQACLTNIENGLDNNVIVIPVPMIGADRWSQIASISKSQEMRPWSVSDDYDRPIARRIAEEMGVERKNFGQKKMGMGASFHFDTYKRMLSKMSPASARSVKDYKKIFRSRKIPTFFRHLKFYFNESPVYLNYLLNKAGIHRKLKYKGKYISSPYATFLLSWGINERQRYYNFDD